MQAKHHLPANPRQVFDVFRMDMDAMQATLRNDIQDLRRHSDSHADLQNSFAHFVVDMESQLCQYNRSSVEKAQAMRNANAQFDALQEQLYGRINDLRGFLDHRLRALESNYEAHPQSTERLIRTLQEQFQYHFYQNHTAGMQALRGMLEQLLVERNIPVTPAAPSPLVSGSQPAPTVAPQPLVADLLHLGVPPPTTSASSTARAQPEFRVAHIPT